MTALPRSLAGRVLLIIFAGLVVAHVASFFLFEAERARALNRFAAAEIATHIAEYVRAPAAPSLEAQAPHAAPQRFRPRLRWVDVETLGDAPAGSSPAPESLARELRHQLAEHFLEDPVVWIATRDAPRREAGGRAGPGRAEAAERRPTPNAAMSPRPGRVVTIALRLPGGRQALAEMTVPQPSLQIPAEGWISIALIFVVTALFSVWAVRLAVQPVRMLAAAADRLSRNISEPPLPEAGPVEIREASHAFNRMQDRLKRHVNSRALAFAAMSHDMRTPLTRIRLRLESLDEAARQKLGDDVAEIEALARSVIEVTRGLAHEEKMVTVDVESLVRRLLQDYEPLGASIGMAGGCMPIEARPAALRRALGNLIDNALKFGREARVELEDAGDRVTIRVCDREPGIPPEEIAKVTTPFYRVESSRSRMTGGAGLGLAIARDIVEGHGGELVLENQQGAGLCATIRLPRSAA